MIDIAMTATIRPNVLEKTLASILKNISYPRLRLVIDIANVGDTRYKVEDVYNIVNKFFKNAVILRDIGETKQAEALKWTWKTAETKYVLQWEDDWVLHKPVDIKKLIKFLEESPGYSMVYLDRYQKSVLNYKNYCGAFRNIGDGFWLKLKGKSLGSTPALIRKKYINQVIPLIAGDICLDSLSKSISAQHLLCNWGFAVYTGEDKTGELVEDIGKKWKRKMGLKMIKNTPRGVTWIKN